MSCSTSDEHEHEPGLVARRLCKGTKVWINGIPLILAADVEAMTKAENWQVIDEAPAKK